MTHTQLIGETGISWWFILLWHQVHHAYEVELDATLGGTIGDVTGHVPVDDDFLFAKQEAQEVYSS